MGLGPTPHVAAPRDGLVMAAPIGPGEPKGEVLGRLGYSHDQTANLRDR
jgi:hypothetical protein